MNRIIVLLKLLFCSTLLLMMCASIPADFLSTLEDRYYNYIKKYPFVSLAISFNQPSYIPGDSVFFSVRYFTEDFRYVKGTHLVRLDVLAQDGSTKQTVKIKITDGIGHNQLVIHEDIEPGIYQFVAYTDWMRNFGSKTFFKQDIAILGKKQFEKRTIQKKIAFYPEGGHLINAMNNHVVVVGIPDQKVEIRDESKNILNILQLNSAGIASFNFRPESNRHYIGFLPDENTTLSFPDAQDDGVAIKYSETDKPNLLLTIPAKSKYADQPIYALIVSQGKLLMSVPVTFDHAGFSRIELPSGYKANALHQFFILDSKGKEIAQRVFTPTGASLIKIKVKVISEVKQRSKFAMSLGVFNESNRLIESDLSLSIIQNELFATKADTILPLFEISSVKAWANEHPREYRPFLNDQLVSSLWDRIDWESIYNNKSPNFQFPFMSQPSFRGMVLSKETNRPAPDSTQVIAYLQRNTMGYEAYTKDGNFEIPIVFDFWDDDLIFYTLRNKGKCIDDRYTVNVLMDTIDLQSNSVLNEITHLDPYAIYASKRNLINQSYAFFSSVNNTNLKQKSLNEVLEEEFQEVDYNVQVSDYVVFPTMEDLLREVVSFIQFRKKGSEPSIRLYYRYEKSVLFFKHDPVYIIDGIMSTNTSYFLSLKPEDLLSIKVINNPNKLAQLGSLGENGFVFVESKKGNLAPNLSNNNLYPVTGLSRSVWNPQREFKGHETQIRTPDLRSNLYWSPYIKSNQREFKEITLMSSDDVGPMRVNIHGFTVDGQPFSTEYIFQVGLNPNRP